MNTRQLQYALEVYETLNFSLVAEKLGITQPALSKQILHLEDELGVKLFERSTQPLTVTPAGEHFFHEIKKILYRQEQLVHSLDEFKSGKRGRLDIGISPFRSLYLMPTILKAVKEKYPDVQVVLHEETSDVLRKHTAEGKFDFAIVNLPVDESVLDTRDLEADTLVLAVPKELSGHLPNKSAKKIKITDCKNIPFVVVSQQQELRQLFDKCCQDENFEPNISVEVVGISTCGTMCEAGLGAAILPLQFVKSMKGIENLLVFELDQKIRTRQPVIITRRGQYISPYAKYAINLLCK